MQLLQANTAVDVLIGPFVDDTDGKTAETGLTLSQADIKLSKNGQALTQKNDVTAAAHDSDGYYNCELDATDTNTEGTLVLIVHESGALPVRHEFMVLAQAAYVSLLTAKDTGFMDVNQKAISDDTTAADNSEAFFDGTGYAGTNNVIPTVTTLTGHTPQTADHTAGIADIPTVAEFNARTLPSADYVVTTDTIAGVTLVATTTAVTNDVGITQAGADKVWSTAARTLTASTNFNDISTADVLAQCLAALDTAYTDADSPTANGIRERLRVLGWILRNKIEVTDANGNTVIYKDDSTTTAFSVNTMLTDDSTTTTRLRAA
jgi:hypothetical protein